LAVATGYGASASGWLSNNCSNYNCFQATNGAGSAFIGGFAGTNFTATNYIQTGNSTTTPALITGDAFHQGAMYFDTTSNCMEVYTNALTFSCLSSGSGVTALNTFFGGVSIVGTANRITVANSANTITLSLPAQTITTRFSATAAGSATAFDAGSGNWLVDGNGIESAVSVNINGGPGNGLNIPNSTSFNAIQTVGGAHLCDAGTCGSNQALTVDGVAILTLSSSIVQLTIPGASNLNGGLITPTSTNSTLHIGTGNFYTRPVNDVSTMVSCSGVVDGWFAISSDPYIVMCLGSNRYRVALTSF
jgi:hypothetical protein